MEGDAASRGSPIPKLCAGWDLLQIKFRRPVKHPARETAVPRQNLPGDPPAGWQQTRAGLLDR